MANIEEAIIKDINIDNSVLWFSTTKLWNSQIEFELRYLDTDNNKSPRTWTQIISSENVGAIINEECIGIALDNIKLTENVAGVEVRIINQGQKYYLRNESNKKSVGIFNIGSSRKTIYISLTTNYSKEVNAIISIAQNSETDKISIGNLPKIDSFEPTYFMLGKRYCTDSNSGPKIRKDLIRRGEEYIVLLDNRKYWDSSNEDCTLDCYIEYKHIEFDYTIEIPLKIKDFDDYVIVNLACKKKWYRTLTGTLACYIRTNAKKDESTLHNCETKRNRVKVATWGSCYTRNMFQNSYNENWRNVIDVCDSYFWFSAISATSEKCENTNFNAFKDSASERNLLNVNREIYKKTFDYLKESKAEYLLIDFYADAVAGVRKINDECYIGQGVALSPDMQLSELYEDIIQCKYKKIDYRDPTYWELWKQHCDMLNDRLKNLGYYQNVILVEGDFITKFKDCNNAITDFKNLEELKELIDMNNIKARAGLWKNMNEYYKSINPECKVLNMSKYHYLGDRDNKMLGPNHFEPNYYKTEFAELCKLILLDKLG